MSARKPVAALGAVAAVLAMAAAAPAAQAAPAAVAHSSTYCTYGNYHAKSKLLTWHKKAVVTHRSNFSASPGYSRSTTRSVSEQASVSSSVKLSSEVSVSVGDPLIGSASAKLGVDLAHTRHHTTTKSEKITETVRNTTKHNATFVFYSGRWYGYGTWERSYCEDLTGSVGEVKWTKGAWHSFGPGDDGVVQCGAGKSDLDAVAKLAYSQGC